MQRDSQTLGNRQHRQRDRRLENRLYIESRLENKLQRDSRLMNRLQRESRLENRDWGQYVS